MQNTLHSRSDIRLVQNMLSTTARQISCSGSGQDFQPWSTPRYCHKNLSIKKRQTRDHPIFIGPIFLHGGSDADTFLLFSQHLAGILFSASSPPTFGSDEEKAMRNAIARAFPTFGRLVCTLHAKRKPERKSR